MTVQSIPGQKVKIGDNSSLRDTWGWMTWRCLMVLSLVSVLTWHSYCPSSPGSTLDSLPGELENRKYFKHSDLRLQMFSLRLMTEDILEMFDNK